MTFFGRPRLLVSRCIEHDSCRWDGQSISSGAVKLLKPYVDFVPICPEVEIGLGIPRDPIRIVRGERSHELYQPAADRYLTDLMEAFIEVFLATVGELDGAILKAGSPSCGMSDAKVYGSKADDALATPGAGLFARAVRREFSKLAMVDEGLLTNRVVRKRFMARINASRSARRARAEWSTVRRCLGPPWLPFCLASAQEASPE